MKNIYLIKNSEKDEEGRFTESLVSYIESRGGHAYVTVKDMDQMREKFSPPEDCDCIMVLGGDGSILRTVRAVYPSSVPLVGVNFGNLGYLTQTEPEGASDLVDQILEDSVRVENRLMLSARVLRNNEEQYSDIALNDVVLGRSGLCRVVHYSIFVNGELLNSYDGDGVIVSTPTGSTAYNLSAGGPVACPKSSVILVTPVSAHTLSARSVVLTDDDIVTISVEKIRDTKEEAVATFDGQSGFYMQPGDVIEIKRSEHDARLIRTGSSSFYEILRNKMR